MLAELMPFYLWLPLVAALGYILWDWSTEGESHRTWRRFVVVAVLLWLLVAVHQLAARLEKLEFHGGHGGAYDHEDTRGSD
jgi:hypothetical protein